MDNLHLQITPLELNCPSRHPLQLTCLYKKVAITTGHILQKHELKAKPNNAAGTHNFQQGPTFNLSREFELYNTKISMHFMNKKERNVTCIGSAEFDVATLPAHPHSQFQVPLNNSIYPSTTMKIQVRRTESKRSLSKPTRYRAQPMNILRTQGQLKEQMLLGRRKDPNVPTAYEISHKNYKQSQTSCHQESKSNTKSKNSSNSKGSYQQKFKASNYSRVNPQGSSLNKNHENHPTPRRKTPEPIPMHQHRHIQKTKKVEPVKHYTIGFNRPKRGIFSTTQSRQQPQQPSQLEVRPYEQNSQGSHSGSSSFTRNGINRYGQLAQKLQQIQQRILNSQNNRYKTQVISKQEQRQAYHQEQTLQRPPLHVHTVKPFSHRSQEELVPSRQSAQGLPTAHELPTFTNYQSSDKESKEVDQSVVDNSQLKTINSPTVSQSPIIHKEVMNHQHSTSPYHQQHSLYHQNPSNIQQNPSKIQEEPLKSHETTSEIYQVPFKGHQYSTNIHKQRSKNSEQSSKIIEAHSSINQAPFKINAKNERTPSKDQQLSSKIHQASFKNIEASSNVHQFPSKINEPLLRTHQVPSTNYQIHQQSCKLSRAPCRSHQAPSKTKEIASNIQEPSPKVNEVTSKSQLSQLQFQNQSLVRQNELIDSKLVNAESTVRKLMEQLRDQLKISNSKDKEINLLKKKVNEHEEIYQGQEKLLSKMTQSYEEKVDEVFELQEQISSFSGGWDSRYQNIELKADSKAKQLQEEKSGKQEEGGKVKDANRQLQERCLALQSELRKRKNALAEVVNMIWKVGDSHLMESVEKYMEQ